MLKKGLVLMLFVWLASYQVYAQGDPAAGKAAYQSCTACHGQNGGGNKALNSPAIAGQEVWYVARQLQNFKAGIRGAHADDTFGAQMAPMAMALASDADVNNVSAYVASLAPATIEHDGGGDAAKGEALYTACAACHGAKAEGVEAMGGPRLDLQQDWYVARQLQNFKAGIRGTHADDTFGAQMAPMAQTLADDQAIKDVAAFIASLGK
ncbi:MAG: c-type cytochrome [Rhodothermales bacterium]